MAGHPLQQYWYNDGYLRLCMQLRRSAAEVQTKGSYCPLV